MPKVPTTLKFVGTVSLGLLTGLSYTLSTITLPTLLALPTAAQATRAFTTLAGRARTQTQGLATLSAVSFFLAYLCAPRAQRHPYLLWTTLVVTSSSAVDYLLRPAARRLAAAGGGVGGTQQQQQQQSKQQHDGKDAAGRVNALKSQAKGKARQMDASYEVVPPGLDSHSDEGLTPSGSDHEAEEEAELASLVGTGTGTGDAPVNGEEVRLAMEGFTMRQMVRTGVAGLAFAMSVVGIWGDGSVESVVFVEM